MSFPILGLDHKNKAYHIKPKAGGNLPFDFNADHSIDLVVAKVNKSAYDLLNDFDIEICKTSWNGKNFKIPNPNQTWKVILRSKSQGSH
jgi:hypothetical protein